MLDFSGDVLFFSTRALVKPLSLSCLPFAEEPTAPAFQRFEGLLPRYIYRVAELTLQNFNR